MKIWKYLSADKIFLDIPLENKEKLIRFLAKIPEKSGYEASADEVAARLINRENTMSTGIGKGIAIPHARRKPIFISKFLRAYRGFVKIGIFQLPHGQSMIR